MADSGEKLQLSEDTISQEACNLAIAGTDSTAIAPPTSSGLCYAT